MELDAIPGLAYSKPSPRARAWWRRWPLRERRSQPLSFRSSWESLVAWHSSSQISKVWTSSQEPTRR